MGRGRHTALLFLPWLFSGCEVEVWLGDPVWAPAAQEAVEGPGPASNCLVAVPSLLDFGAVGAGERSEKQLSLRNTCQAPVSLQGFVLSGNPDFSLELEGVAWSSATLNAVEGITFERDFSLLEGAEALFALSYEPSSGEGAYANLVWLTDVGAGALGLAVQLKGNVQSACAVTFPKVLDFGGALVGSSSARELLLKSCGSGDLRVHAASITGPDAAHFSIENGPSSLDEALAPGMLRTLSLRYTPEAEGESGDGGAPARDRATLHLETNAFEPTWSVALSAFGARQPCPHAIITGEVPESIPPGESVTLDGRASYGIGVDVVAWEWSLEAPAGADASLVVGDDPARVTLQSEALGLHVISLDVVDERGLSACAPTLFEVDVVPPSGVAVELWWETGNDLDLHLLHPLAVGLDVDGDGTYDGWFDKPYDTFWANPMPNWGVVGDPKAEDDPVLNADDHDGFGPERILLGSPEPGQAYRVGVHHWDARGVGYGDLWVRVWRDGALLAEETGVDVPNDVLWEVGTIESDGTWTTPESGPRLHVGVRKPEGLKVP